MVVMFWVVVGVGAYILGVGSGVHIFWVLVGSAWFVMSSCVWLVVVNGGW